MKKALSFDIGGTKISHAIIDESGNFVTAKTKVHTPNTAQDIFDLLKKLIQENYEKIDVVSLATAGAVNIDNTKVCSSTPNLPEGYPDLVFTDLTDKKVFVENDANAAAWGEYKCGAAKDCSHVLMVTLGTGIGGGVIENGKLVRGKNGAALEVGSMKIFADKRRKCTCGRYDCWESYASGTGLKNTAKEMAKCSKEITQSIYKDKTPEELTTYDITEGIKANDEFSKQVFEQWQEYIFTGLVGLVDIFNPECVVISGGMGKFANIKELESKINQESVVPDISIRHAILDNDAGMVGAALLALS